MSVSQAVAPDAASRPDAAAVREVLRKAGLPDIAQAAAQKTADYLILLLKWNRAMNLVGVRTWEEALSKLLADSIFLESFLSQLPLPENPEIWDFGAGAGLPGIPLRILYPHGTYRMVEAREKRSLFINNVLARLKLPRTFIHQNRVENFLRNPPGPERADLIISRAFKPWPEVLALAEPHLALGGQVLIMANGHIRETPPAGWVDNGCLAYETPGGKRRFQAFTPGACSGEFMAQT